MDWAGTVCDAYVSAGATGAGFSASEGMPFDLGHAAPDSGLLARPDGPLQTGIKDHASTTNRLCLFDLDDRGMVDTDREEQLGALVQAGGAVAPCHLHRARFIEAMVTWCLPFASGCLDQSDLGTLVWRSRWVKHEETTKIDLPPSRHSRGRHPGGFFGHVILLFLISSDLHHRVGGWHADVLGDGGGFETAQPVGVGNHR